MQAGNTVNQSTYSNCIEELIKWCHDSALFINEAKTKEMVIKKPRNSCHDLIPVVLNDQHVEEVEELKYLGTFFDSTLSFTKNTEYIFKKAMQRLYLLRKLNSYGVSEDILETVYRSLIESVLTFDMYTWFGNLGVRNRNTLSRIVKMGSKIVGKGQRQLTDIYTTRMRRKAQHIVSDPVHPLFTEFKKLPSGRRYRAAIATKNIYKKSFIPSAISLLNSQ